MMNAKDVNVAEPIQNPLPIAAVVLPTESNLSVISLTSWGKSAICAIPPALSLIGPYPSTLTVIPTVHNIPTAANAIPYPPAPTWAASPKKYATAITTAKAKIVRAVDFIPEPKPAIIFVAWPVWLSLAITFTSL